MVICSGDCGGIIGAAIVMRDFGLKPTKTQIIITEPHLINQVEIGDEAMAIFVISLEINNESFDAITNFATQHKDAIVSWVDHHPGTEEALEQILNSVLIADDRRSSCADLLDYAGFKVPDAWLEAANASEQPTKYPTRKLSDRFNQALKAARIKEQYIIDPKSVTDVQHAFLHELLEEKESIIVSYYEGLYGKIMLSTKQAIESLTELIPGVGLVCLPENMIDRNLLFSEGHKKFPVLALQFNLPDTLEPVTTVSTNLKTLNLSQLFKLPVESASLVNLFGDFETVKQLLCEKL
ncbi:MAG: hypothetical protein WAW11_05035 [Patescibacteria group bacterium]